MLAEGSMKSGSGGDFTLGHPSGTFGLHVEPVIPDDPTAVTFTALTFPRTARILCDGTVYIKNEQPPEIKDWVEAYEITATSFFLDEDQVSVQRNR